MNLSPSFVKNALIDTINEIEDNRHLYLKNPDFDMTRHRKLPAADTVRLVLSFEGHTLPGELKAYFGFSPDRPSPSALIQQRSKFTDGAFPALFRSFNDKIPFTEKIFGLNVFAVDGSDLNLLPEKSDHENYVSYPSGNGGYYQIHANALFNVGEGRFFDVELQPRPKMNENAALASMIGRCSFPENSLVICDRGYMSFNTVAHLAEKGLFFLIRCKDPKKKTSFLKHSELPDSREYDVDISKVLTRSRAKYIREHKEAFSVISPHSRFDFIEPDDRQSMYRVSMRAVRFPLSEDGDEVLITNLPREKFPVDMLKQLYHRRWEIETAFRRLKYAILLTRMHSRRRDLVKQEIYARFIMFNFVSAVYAAVSRKAGRKNRSQRCKYEHRPSFNESVGLIRDFIKRQYSDRKIKALLRMEMVAVKPNRHHPRNVRSQTAIPSNNRA